MEVKRFTVSDVQRAMEEATMENEWVDISHLSLNALNEEPTMTGDGFLPTDNIISCKICHVNFSGIAPYEQHINGAKHQKKVKKDAMKKKYGPKYLEALSNQETKDEPTVEKTDSTTGDDAEVIKCEICNKLCTGLIPYKLHISGKAHHKQLRKQNCIEKLQEDPQFNDIGKEVADNSVYEVMPQVKPFAQCDICGKKFSGPEGYQGHLSSGSHKRKLEMLKLTEKLTGGKSHPESTGANNESEQEFFARCSTCEKNFSGPVPYEQHLISEAHQKKLKKLELVEKMKSLSTNDGKEDVFHCKDCNRSFNIPEEFKQHLNSTSHNKRKDRQQKAEKLQKEYPEMKVQITAPNHDDSSANEIHLLDDIILICMVCHKSFTGPETAAAHFTSPKHARAKKQHLLLMRQKNTEIKDTI